MKLKYLGTAAAEGIPGLFCNCDVCRNALKVKGKEIKTRSQAIIDDTLLIDFPQDTYMHVINHGLDLRNIHHCLITHSHSDHFYPNDLWCRFKNMANNIPDKPLNIYATQAGFGATQARYGDNAINSDRLKLHLISPFEELNIAGYRVVPLKADHDASTNPVIYIIEKDGKSLLYANDTGIFPDETWAYLQEYGKIFDMISLDCTAMALPGWKSGHMGLDSNKIVCDRLVQMGRCNENTTVYVNHFSHNGKLTHEQLVVEAAKYGFGASYDGLEVEF